MKWVLPVVIVIALVLLVFGYIQLTGEVTGTDTPTKTCRTVQEAYPEIETYTKYLQAQVISRNYQELWDLSRGAYARGTIKLKNIDNEAGWFTVTFNWRTLDDTATYNVRHYLEPEETAEFISDLDVKLHEDSEYTYTYTSDPIEKTRTVTKYRDKEVCD